MLLSTNAARVLFRSSNIITKSLTTTACKVSVVAPITCSAYSTFTMNSPRTKASSSSSLTNINHEKRRYKSTAMVPPHDSDETYTFDTTGRDAYNVSRTVQGSDACSKVGIDKQLGITGPKTLYRNLTYPQLFEHEQVNQEGVVAKAEYGPTFTVDTGKYTGRSPKDRWIVFNPGSETAENFDWNSINMPTKPEVFDELYNKAISYFNTRDTAYIFDGYCGANRNTRKKIRFVHEMAWQQHFVTNMFIRPENESELDDFEPDFTVINCCSQVDEDWKRHGLNSETAVVFNVEKKTAVIFGTWYGGENKKGIFSLMNYWLPMMGHFPMHCSANVGKSGDVALFFGLSGTGKTTLSADPERALIGDDEHGWDDDGVFNFEGGCYAKTINLSEKTEPDIYRAIHTDALLENVKIKDDGVPDYFDTSKTENGRVSYPIFHIPGYHKEQHAGHPNNVIFLSCDAFGILPPIAKLSSGQAMYQFLSGYTAKVAGTERGVKEPTATFSTCFGAAFMTLHPTRYADLLQHKLEKHGSHAYLVNSGWSGGPYGVGKRMSIATTRNCINAILNGSIHDAEFKKDPLFGFDVPVALPGVDAHLLDPRSTWSNPDEYEAMEAKLASMFIENFKKYEGKGSVDYTQFGPKVDKH